MSRKKKQNITIKLTKKNLIIFSVIFVIIVISLIIIYKNDKFIKVRHILNDTITEATGWDAEKALCGCDERNQDIITVQGTESSESEVTSSETLEDQQTAETERKDDTTSKNKGSKKPDKNKNYEFPLCRKNALQITEKNTKGVLETPEKEDSHQIIYHNGFTLCYREKYEQAEWVCYTLNAEKIQKNVDRNDNFRPDPLVITGSAELSDYKGTGYDRGHLCPSADLTYSFETMDESFVMSNMSPQAAKFNRGMWKDLEHEVRTLTAHYDTLYVVTGPVLEKDEYPVVGKNDVAVPEYYYKAILGVKGNTWSMIGFILPNENCKGTIWDYAVSVDEVERRTNLDFFSQLDDELENSLEKKCPIESWKF